MSHFQGSPVSVSQPFLDFAFPLTNKTFPFCQLPTLESPPSSVDSNSKDWMTSLLALESYNKASLMNVMQISASPKTFQNYASTFRMAERQPSPTYDLKKNTNKLPKIEEKLEPELEDPVLRKKVKVDSDGVEVQPDLASLSSLVDEQMQKLPPNVLESIERILAKNKNPSIKSPKSVGSPAGKYIKVCNPNMNDKPLRIIAFKFDSKRQDFMYQVEWRQRADGTKPHNSFLTKGEMMKIDPAMIIAYYEKQIAQTFQHF